MRQVLLSTALKAVGVSPPFENNVDRIKFPIYHTDDKQISLATLIKSISTFKLI